MQQGARRFSNIANLKTTAGSRFGIALREPFGEVSQKTPVSYFLFTVRASGKASLNFDDPFFFSAQYLIQTLSPGPFRIR